MSLSYGFCLGLEGKKNSAEEFSRAFQSVFGDGVDGLEVSPAGIMNLSLSEGFAMAGGWWIKIDEVETLTAQPANNNYDRWDCVIVRADLTNRTVSTVLVTGTPGENPEKYTPVKNDTLYELPLYHVLVRFGATSIIKSDIEKAPESIPLMSMDSIASQVVKIYDFLNGGIDERVDKIAQKADEILSKSEETISSIEQAMDAASVSKLVGDVELLLNPPTPSKTWLKCDGSPVPPEYPQISALVGDTMPLFSIQSNKHTAWMYAGQPTTKHPKI